MTGSDSKGRQTVKSVREKREYKFKWGWTCRRSNSMAKISPEITWA